MIEGNTLDASQCSWGFHNDPLSRTGRRKETIKKNKVQVKEKSKQSKKKSRTRKLEKDDMFFEELAESEAAFFSNSKKSKEKLK